MLKNGFNGTGVEAILKEANVPKGSFYNHFPSKEEFGLAVIDQFRADIHAVIGPILADRSVRPLTRLRKCFETLTDRFERNHCTRGCLIGNLALEMSGQSESIRHRLAEALRQWIDAFARTLTEAQQAKAIPADLDPRRLAESLVASFEGALLLGKVTKSPEPLTNFVTLFFGRILTKKAKKRVQGSTRS
jgi:TetR/AcrR family transcriptional repressor of nem operon